MTLAVLRAKRWRPTYKWTDRPTGRRTKPLVDLRTEISYFEEGKAQEKPKKNKYKKKKKLQNSSLISKEIREIGRDKFESENGFYSARRSSVDSG